MPAVTSKGASQRQKVTNSKKTKPDKSPGGGKTDPRCQVQGKTCSVTKTCCKGLQCLSGRCAPKGSGGGGGDGGGGGSDGGGGGGGTGGQTYKEFFVDRDLQGSVNKWGPLMERRDYPNISDADEMKEALAAELDVIGMVLTTVEIDVANVDSCWATFREGDTITVELGNSGYTGAIRVMVRALDVTRGIMTVAGVSVDGR